MMRRPGLSIKNVAALCLLAGIAASVVLPTEANARPRQECRRVWVHGHYVRRCRPIPPPRHHRPPPPRRPTPYRP